MSLYLKFFVFPILILLVLGCRADSNDSKRYALKLSESFIERTPEYIKYPEKKVKWNYEQGVMLMAMRKMYESTNDSVYLNFIIEKIDRFVDDSGTINAYKKSDYNLDKINSGKALLFLYEETKDEKYKIAADSLNAQLKEQPRTKSGGFWHKKIYPNQMWLDGLYMAQPFAAHYIQLFGENKNYDDVVFQISHVYNKTYNEKTGLLYHAWNEDKKQSWADPETGTSPHFWGRAIGWYLMAVVDVLDYLPENHPNRNELIEILTTLSESLLEYRDEKTGLWYQILNLPDRKGNYLESSCAAMYCYVFAKGAKNNYLDPKFKLIADEVFDKIIEIHTKFDENGHVNLYNTCSSAGLGGDPYRDGSFEYYISEPKRMNDYKGVGPLIFAAVELGK